MTRDDAQAWLDGYVDAWRTYDPKAIGALFSENAEYRYHPWDDPVRGRDAIVADWLSPDGDPGGRDEPGTYDAGYEPWAIDGDRVVAVGTSTYWTELDRSTVERVYSNVYLIDFDVEGLCRSFIELFMKHPDGAGRA